MSVEASRVQTTINAPPAAVWKALMTPSKFKQFFYGSDIETDWKVGSPMKFRGEWKGKKYEDKGEVTAVDEPKKLAFTHWSPLSGMPDTPENYHVVSFDLRPAGAATAVVLTQTNQNDAEPLTAKNRAEYDKNWTMVLEGLKKAVEE
jgi:uncharacterized protein YndB with AHSA1/START domain